MELSRINPGDLFEDSEDGEPSRKAMRGSSSTDLRFNLISEAIHRTLGKDRLSEDIEKYLHAECKVLADKVNRSLNLLSKREKLLGHINALERGEVPSGVKPFKIVVESPQLDLPVPANCLEVNMVAPLGTTYRQMKERIHFLEIVWMKKLDIQIMEKQIEELRDEITGDKFIARVTSKVASKSTDLDSLMERLSLGPHGSQAEQARLSAEKAEKLYLDVMNSIAQASKESAKKEKEKQESFTKTVDALKGAKPADLLQKTVEHAVAVALKGKGKAATGSAASSKQDKGKGKGIRAPPGLEINWSEAYTLAVGDPEGLDAAVKEPDFRKGKSKGRQKGDQEKKKGKGKGKSKGKNKWYGASQRNAKGKGNGKDQEKEKKRSKSKEKGKGKQGSASRKGKGKEGKGAKSGRGR